MECDKVETFLKCLPSGDPTIHFVFMKNGNNRPCLLIIIPFKIYLQSFPIQKLFIFVNENENGFHSINVEKVFQRLLFKNVAQLGNHGPNHADDNPRKLKKTIRCTCGHGAVSTRTLEKIYFYRTDVVVSSMTNFREIQNS